jgi:hypothetical protein
MAWCSVKAQGQIYLYLYEEDEKDVAWRYWVPQGFPMDLTVK